MKQNLHIVLVAPKWPASTAANGISTYVHLMKAALVEIGHRVTVVVLIDDRSPRDPEALYVVRNWIEHMRARVLSRFGRGDSIPFDYGSSILRVLSDLHKRSPIDVIEIEETFGWFGEIAKKVRVPMVVKLHGPACLSSGYEIVVTELTRRKIEHEASALRRAAIVVAPCRHTLDMTAQSCGMKPVVSDVMFNPVELATVENRWSPDSTDFPTVLFIGRFERRKGADTMLIAFRELLQVIPNARLQFAGPELGVEIDSGEVLGFNAYVRTVFLEEQLGQVEFLGKVDQGRLTRLRSQAHVVVSALQWENQSYAQAEAMAQGCPVVVANFGGQAEMMEHDVSGLLAEPNDSSDLARQVARMIQDPAAASRMGREARRVIESRYAANVVAKKALSVYERAFAATAR